MLERSIAAASRFGQLLEEILLSRTSWALGAYLTRGVDNLSSIVLTAMLDRFAERVLNRGIVAVYEMALHKLYRERGFPYVIDPISCCVRSSLQPARLNVEGGAYQLTGCQQRPICAVSRTQAYSVLILKLWCKDKKSGAKWWGASGR